MRSYLSEQGYKENLDWYLNLWFRLSEISKCSKNTTKKMLWTADEKRTNSTWLRKVVKIKPRTLEKRGDLCT